MSSQSNGQIFTLSTEDCQTLTNSAGIMATADPAAYFTYLIQTGLLAMHKHEEDKDFFVLMLSALSYAEKISNGEIYDGEIEIRIPPGSSEEVEEEEY